MSKLVKTIATLGVVAGLGVAALPLSTYAVDETSGTPSTMPGEQSNVVTVRTKVNSSIAVTAVAPTTVELGTIAAGSPIAHNTTTVTVSGSVPKYNLALVDEDTDTNMTWKRIDVDQTESDGTITDEVIPTLVANDQGEYPNLEEQALGWGFRLYDEHNPRSWQGVPAYGKATANLVSGGTLLTGSDASSSVDTRVEFGVKVNNTIKNGIYEDRVIFIASAAE